MARTDGQPAGPGAPAVTVRLERRQTAARWRTSMTLQDLERPAIRGLATGPAVDNPFVVVRMEYDEDGTPPRMYDRYGRLVRPLREPDRLRLHTPATLAAGLPVLESLAGRVGAPPAALVGQDWIDGVLVPLDKRLVRRAALERQLGRPVGRLRGFDRFLTRIGEDTHEVLVDLDAAVPVEINTMRGGQLAARTTFSHTRDGAGALTGRTSRTERALPGATGARSITDVELANIQLSAGGVQ